MTDVANGTTQLGLPNGWGSTNNNGNLLSETINGGGLTFNQSVGYDALNRLTSASHTGCPNGHMVYRSDRRHSLQF